MDVRFYDVWWGIGVGDSLLVVQLLSGSGGLFGGSEGDETEATAAAGLTVLHDDLGLVSGMVDGVRGVGVDVAFCSLTESTIWPY